MYYSTNINFNVSCIMSRTLFIIKFCWWNLNVLWIYYEGLFDFTVPWIYYEYLWMFLNVFECDMNVIWMFTNVISMCLECIMNVSWMYHECIVNVSWMYLECIMNVNVSRMWKKLYSRLTDGHKISMTN